MQEKLGLVQQEAEAAVADAGEQPTSDERQEGEVVATKIKRSPSKKARVSGRPRKRKSTLTRDEMADLLAGLID